MAPTATAPVKTEPRTMSTDQTGLEKAAPKTPAVITTPEEYRGAVLRWQEQHFNVLTPFANISGLMPSHGIFSSAIQISLDASTQETYTGLPFLKRDDVAIAKRGLRKIAEGLGISTRLEYISVADKPHYWHVKAIASYRGLDGGTVEREASQEWDLRDGSDRMRGWTPNQISEQRKHGLRACETRAINAAIRECGCGIKQSYTRDELSRPFLAVRVMFMPNMDNPDERRAVLDRALGSTNAMYPSRALPATGPAFDDEPLEPAGPKQVGGGPSNPNAATPPAKVSAPDPDVPPCEGAVRIVEIKTSTGTRKDKTVWTRYAIIDSQGVQHSTFDKSIAEFAQKAKETKQWVELSEEVDGDFRNLIEIAPAGQQPALPEMGNL